MTVCHFVLNLSNLIWTSRYLRLMNLAKTRKKILNDIFIIRAIIISFNIFSFKLSKFPYIQISKEAQQLAKKVIIYNLTPFCAKNDNAF